MGIGNAIIEEDEELQKELVRLAKRRKVKRKIVFSIVAFLTVLLVVFGAYMVGKYSGKKNDKRYKNVKNERKIGVVIRKIDQ